MLTVVKSKDVTALPVPAARLTTFPRTLIISSFVVTVVTKLGAARAPRTVTGKTMRQKVRDRANH